MALVRNAASEKQLKRAAWRLDDRANRQAADLKSILQIPAGRRLLWALLERCNVFSPLGHDALMIHSNEGRRLVGLELMADITAADPFAYLTLLGEALKAQTLENGESDALNLRSEDDDE